MQIYITKNGMQTGPFTEEQTRSMVSAGLLSLDDLAWIDGKSNWQPLRFILDFSQPPPVLTNSTQATYASVIKSPQSGPMVVGGWLVFFCVCLTMLCPLFTLGQIASEFTAQTEPVFAAFPSLKSICVFEDIGSVILVVYGVVVGFVVWNGNPHGREIARRFLLTRLCGIVGIELIVLFLMRDLPHELLSGGLGGVAVTLIREVLFFAIWWSYFMKSKRVRNTYGDEPAKISLTWFNKN